MNYRAEIDKLFGNYKQSLPIKIQVNEDWDFKTTSICLTMKWNDKDELINSIVEAGEVSHKVLSALSEAMRDGRLKLEPSGERPEITAEREYYKRMYDL